jgi:hypothetical protein
MESPYLQFVVTLSDEAHKGTAVLRIEHGLDFLPEPETSAEVAAVGFRGGS